MYTLNIIFRGCKVYGYNKVNCNFWLLKQKTNCTMAKVDPCCKIVNNRGVAKIHNFFVWNVAYSFQIQ